MKKKPYDRTKEIDLVIRNSHYRTEKLIWQTICFRCENLDWFETPHGAVTLSYEWYIGYSSKIVTVKISCLGRDEAERMRLSHTRKVFFAL